jgi:hypothetical protein
LCEGPNPVHREEDLPTFAAAKLLNIDSKHLLSEPWDTVSKSLDKRLRLLAPLAARLSLRLGPDRVEASELLSGHLGVLIRESGAHQLEVVYPSEPVVAEGAARLLNYLGWAKPLRELNAYLLSGIVSAGFRGEL